MVLMISRGMIFPTKLWTFYEILQQLIKSENMKMYDSVNPNLPNLLLCIFKNAIQNDINVTLPLSFVRFGTDSQNNSK